MNDFKRSEQMRSSITIDIEEYDRLKNLENLFYQRAKIRNQVDQNVYNKGFYDARNEAALMVQKYFDFIIDGLVETSPKSFRYVVEDINIMEPGPYSDKVTI